MPSQYAVCPYLRISDSGSGQDSNPNCHSFSCKSLSWFINVLTSFRRKICPFYWWQVGHTTRINHLFEKLQEAAVHNFDNIYIATTFCKKDSSFIPCRESCLSANFQAVFVWLCSFQNNVVHFCNKTRYGYEFLMK